MCSVSRQLVGLQLAEERIRPLDGPGVEHRCELALQPSGSLGIARLSVPARFVRLRRSYPSWVIRWQSLGLDRRGPFDARVSKVG